MPRELFELPELSEAELERLEVLEPERLEVSLLTTFVVPSEQLFLPEL